MSDRRPLVSLPAGERKRLLDELGLGDDLLPYSLTPEERKAAQNPGLPDPNWRSPMETKPGWKTSEFWLKLAAGAAIALLMFTLDHGLPAIAAQLPSLGWIGSILVLGVPLAKVALGWVLAKLTEKYAAGRVEVKVAALAAASGKALA